MRPARRAKWAVTMEALHQEAAGVLEIWAVLLTDMVPMLAEAHAGNHEALRVLQIINHALSRMSSAPTGQEPICGCCSAPLHGSDFSFVVAVPSVDNPRRALALAICPSCGVDRTSVRAAGVRAMKDVWPESREIGPLTQGGRA
jgi:hypothetical protein